MHSPPARDPSDAPRAAGSKSPDVLVVDSPADASTRRHDLHRDQAQYREAVGKRGRRGLPDDPGPAAYEAWMYARSAPGSAQEING